VAYDEDLADRIRTVLPAGEAVTERQMFGGLAFMLGGRMFCGIVRTPSWPGSAPRPSAALWASLTYGRWTSPAGP
jgi:hypothetical protein